MSPWVEQILRAVGRVIGMEVPIGSVGKTFESILKGDSGTGKSGQTGASMKADIANVQV